MQINFEDVHDLAERIREANAEFKKLTASESYPYDRSEFIAACLAFGVESAADMLRIA